MKFIRFFLRIHLCAFYSEKRKAFYSCGGKEFLWQCRVDLSFFPEFSRSQTKIKREREMPAATKRRKTNPMEGVPSFISKLVGFSGFSTIRELARLACTCQKTHNSLRGTGVDVCEHPIDTEDFLAFFRPAGLWRPTGVTMLHRRKSSLSFLFNFQSNLKRINLNNSACLRDLSQLVHCPNLDTLEIDSACRLTDLSPLPLCCPRLHVLYLITCDALENIDPLGECGELEILSLAHCSSLQSINSLGKCQNLKQLYLSHCESLVNVEGLGNCSQLEQVEISSCYNLMDMGDLGKCPNLKTIDSSYCDSLWTLEGLGSYDQLERINLSGCCNLTDVSALATCQNLLSVSLKECKNLVSAAALGNCSRLETLYFRFCDSLEDFSVARCTNLTSVSLSVCGKITSVESLRNKNKLEAFYFTHSKQTIDFEPLQSCGSLRNLWVSGSYNLETLEMMQKKNTALKILFA
jgi:Leucine-rich repeat (LRR) protein